MPRVCTCTQPIPAANPRLNHCLRCCFRLADPQTRPVKKPGRCARCNSAVDLQTSYVIGFSKQAAMEWIYLCDECRVDLRVWVGEVPL